MLMHTYTSDQEYLQHLADVLLNNNPIHMMGADSDTQEHTVSVSLSRAIAQAVWFNNTAMSELTPDTTPGPVVLNWTGSDNQSAYERHCADPITNNKLKAGGWTDSNIRYELNSEGWRSAGCAEYDVDEPCLIALGCSFTFGTGLNLDQTWSAKVADQLGLRLVNLGMPGHSLDLSTAWLTINQHRLRDPRAVIICEPPPGRMSWVTHNHIMSMSYGHTLLRMVRGSAETPVSSLGAYEWLINNLKINSAISYYKNSSVARLWASQRTIPFMHFNGLDDTVPTSLARDLSHHGEPWHDAIANSILEWAETHVKNL